MAQLNNLTQEVALATGDAFVCASEKQRDFWLGALASAGRLDRASYQRDPSLRTLVDVVPFGIDPEPPAPGPAMRGVVPGIGPDDRVLLWPGGIWNWFDPLTVIRAVARTFAARPTCDCSSSACSTRTRRAGDARWPSGQSRSRRSSGSATALSSSISVGFRTPSAARYLLDADLAVSAHFDDVETRFAFRTRLLDCLWAGLPVVTTRGDSLGELIVAGGGGGRGRRRRRGGLGRRRSRTLLRRRTARAGARGGGARSVPRSSGRAWSSRFAGSSIQRPGERRQSRPPVAWRHDSPCCGCASALPAMASVGQRGS